MSKMLGLSSHLTHQGNHKQTRYGWLRLTPAHSIHLIKELLNGQKEEIEPVLDPFCGTGTTALVCAEQGIPCDTTDINPFLVWLTHVKTHQYTEGEIANFRKDYDVVLSQLTTLESREVWTPPIHQIEKWWNAPTLSWIGRLYATIQESVSDRSPSILNLMLIAFCRLIIEQANVSFGHQSMSFKKTDFSLNLFAEETLLQQCWQDTCNGIANTASSNIVSLPRVLCLDARRLTSQLPENYYGCVITSPPYPNRMSYIRELRPYMYWLGYLDNGKQAGELDWKAIGGTWGVATSNLCKWEPSVVPCIPYHEFELLIQSIEQHSRLLARYVQKYFFDIAEHLRELYKVVRRGGKIHYIVGNSKFYDVVLPVEQIFAAMFEGVGFVEVKVRMIRKRTSKRELYEYVVSASKP